MKTTLPAWTALIAMAFVLAGLVAGEQPAQKKPDAKKSIFDEKANAKADIKAALHSAGRENRRVLIQWGRNNCAICDQLNGALRTNALRKILLYEYVVVRVDIGESGKGNAELAGKYNTMAGAPGFTVVDANDKVLANHAISSFIAKAEDGKEGVDAKKLLDVLISHQAKPWNAEEVLTTKLGEAAKTDRMVFLHFGAPWCGWCLKLEAWLDQPKIAEVIGKDFVDVKIDQDRMTGGKELLAKYNKEGKGGIPWFVFMDGKGKVVATSDGPKGNVGFPYEPHEIDHFVTMLNAAKQRISSDEVDVIRRSLAPLKNGK